MGESSVIILLLRYVLVTIFTSVILMPVHNELQTDAIDQF